ncbi:MAG: hypothetical protein UHD64_03625 [Bacteroidales bacterium]|nr:hypothetical protein [Bacteroidales bacterium]
MKIRNDFVTNSSSSSYIICFARITDEEKAKKIIDKYDLDVLSASDVKHEMRWGELGADWAGATLWGTDKILQAHPNDKYIIIEDSNDAYYDEDDYEPIYDYDFAMNDAIEEITEENGFADIDCAEGEGRNG